MILIIYNNKNGFLMETKMVLLENIKKGKTFDSIKYKSKNSQKVNIMENLLVENLLLEKNSKKINLINEYFFIFSFI